jgi:hypothetical protein
MKNKNLKSCFAIILLFAMHSLKAQSVIQKQQNDIEQRRRSANETMQKAREQQTQQQDERTREVTVQTIPATKVQPNTQAVQIRESKSPARKQSTTQQKNKPVVSKE